MTWLIWIKAKWQTIKIVLIGIIVLVFLYLRHYIKILKRQLEESERYIDINKKNEEIRKDRDRLQAEKDKIHDAITGKVRDVDKVEDPEDKDKIDFGKWGVLILIPLLFLSCTTRTIYEQVYVKPAIPRLLIIENPVLEELSISPNEDGVYCLTYEEVAMLYRNEQRFKNLIDFYKLQVTLYLDFYEQYYKE